MQPDPPDTRARTRRRKDRRLGLLRRRTALASAAGFVAFLLLAAQHAVGSAKHAGAGTAAPAPTASGPTRYFDDTGGGYAFDDGPAPAPAPPVAQTNVS